MGIAAQHLARWQGLHHGPSGKLTGCAEVVGLGEQVGDAHAVGHGARSADLEKHGIAVARPASQQVGIAVLVCGDGGLVAPRAADPSEAWPVGLAQRRSGRQPLTVADRSAQLWAIDLPRGCQILLGAMAFAEMGRCKGCALRDHCGSEQQPATDRPTARQDGRERHRRGGDGGQRASAGVVAGLLYGGDRCGRQQQRQPPPVRLIEFKHGPEARQQHSCHGQPRPALPSLRVGRRQSIRDQQGDQGHGSGNPAPRHAERSKARQPAERRQQGSVVTEREQDGERDAGPEQPGTCAPSQPQGREGEGCRANESDGLVVGGGDQLGCSPPPYRGRNGRPQGRRRGRVGSGDLERLGQAAVERWAEVQRRSELGGGEQGGGGSDASQSEQRAASPQQRRLRRGRGARGAAAVQRSDGTGGEGKCGDRQGHPADLRMTSQQLHGEGGGGPPQPCRLGRVQPAQQQQPHPRPPGPSLHKADMTCPDMAPRRSAVTDEDRHGRSRQRGQARIPRADEQPPADQQPAEVQPQLPLRTPPWRQQVQEVRRIEQAELPAGEGRHAAEHVGIPPRRLASCDKPRHRRAQRILVRKQVSTVAKVQPATETIEQRQDDGQKRPGPGRPRHTLGGRRRGCWLGHAASRAAVSTVASPASEVRLSGSSS
jgi:hypothetical protein